MYMVANYINYTHIYIYTYMIHISYNMCAHTIVSAQLIRRVAGIYIYICIYIYIECNQGSSATCTYIYTHIYI